MMSFSPYIRLGLALMLLCLGVAAPATAQNFDDDETYDPFEPVNRAIYKFNDVFDRAVLKPVAKGYDFITPDPVQNAISRFFNNLFMPTVVVNDLLQAKFTQGAADTGRFLVNSTLGVVGFFDVARHWRMPAHEEDLGQTFGHWGLGEGPYLVIPILGPRNLRDGVGLVGDLFTSPVTYVDDNGARWGLWALTTVDTRAQLLGASNILEQAAGQDEYLFVREAYRQRRRNLVYDGNPPKPKFFDDYSDELPPASE